MDSAHALHATAAFQDIQKQTQLHIHLLHSHTYYLDRRNSWLTDFLITSTFLRNFLPSPTLFPPTPRYEHAVFENADVQTAVSRRKGDAV